MTTAKNNFGFSVSNKSQVDFVDFVDFVLGQKLNQGFWTRKGLHHGF